MTTAPNFYPTIIAVILITSRQVNPILKPLVTRTTVGLFAVWAVLALLASTGGRDFVWNGIPLLEDAALAACYLGIASLLVKVPALLWLIAKSATEETNESRTSLGRITRVISIGGIAVLVYIVSTHWS